MAARVFTQQELEKAFNARRGPTWPEDLDAALHDRAFRSLIQIEARRQAMRANEPVPQKQSANRFPVVPKAMPTNAPLDFKRLASGERDDD